MKLNIKIRNIKNISDLEVELPLERGLYAITGENGCGKSTLVACASTLFYHNDDWFNNFFGKVENGASIHFSCGKNTYNWDYNDGWQWSGDRYFGVKGFFEGSLIYGTRFKDTSYNKIRNLRDIDITKLNATPEFVREHLGQILHGDSNYYSNLRKLNKRNYKFDGDVFFYEKNEKHISQFHMSTGENLLISLLNSLYYRIKSNKRQKEYTILFIDEIELALHPAALMRMVAFLKDLAKAHNLAIYFSTHSIELISAIKPQNIFYVERYPNNRIDIINPCYPAFASRNLYVHAGYDDIILVEDDLAKTIVDKIVYERNLIGQRLVLVQPVGGYMQVLSLAADATKYNFLGVHTSICVILDKDIQSQAVSFIEKRGLHLSNKVNYLPIESLEKYLRRVLYTNVDTQLFRKLNTFIFRVKNLNDIIKEYDLDENAMPDRRKDKTGKRLFAAISEELKNRGVTRETLVNTIVDYLFENNAIDIDSMVNVLKTQLSRKSE